MSRFVDRFESHQIHDSLNTIDSIINELLERENMQPDALLELEQARHVLNYLKLMLDNCDPTLIPPTVLNNLNDNMAKRIISELTNFRSTNNNVYLVNVNNHLDSHIPTISNLVVPHLPTDIDGIKQSIVTFKRLASRSIRETESEFKRVESIKNELEQGFSQISTTVEDQRSRLEAILEDFQQDFSDAQKSRDEDYDKRTKEISILFDNLINQKVNDAEVVIKEIEGRGQELEEYFSVQVSEYISKLDDYKSQAERIMNAISNTSMVGRYQEVANQEKDSFEFWRRFTTGSMIALCFFALINFFFLPIGTEVIWADIGKRLFVAATLATLAGFASRQAKIHLEASRKYRKIELELTSLNPYLLELEDDKRKEILAEMVGKFFGKDEVENPPNDTRENPLHDLQNKTD